MKVCNKIAMVQNFPNDKIIEIYMSKKQGDFSGKSGLQIVSHLSISMKFLHVVQSVLMVRKGEYEGYFQDPWIGCT